MKLYLKVEPHKYPQGHVRGYRKQNGSVDHIARLFWDKPVEVKEKDALTLVEKHDDIAIWDEKAAKEVRAKKIELDRQRTLEAQRPKNMGPLPQPTKNRKKSPLEEEEGEKISDEELNDPLVSEQPPDGEIHHLPPEDEMTEDDKAEAEDNKPLPKPKKKASSAAERIAGPAPSDEPPPTGK